MMALPALFAAAMMLIDSLDSVIMAGAYRGTRSDPTIGLWYNLFVTSASLVLAASIATIELLGALPGSEDGYPTIARLSAPDVAAEIGVGIVGFFVLSRLGLALIARSRRAGRGPRLAGRP